MKNEFEPDRDISLFDAINEYLNEKESISALSQKSIINRRYELNSFAKFCLKHKIEKPWEIHKNLIVSYLKSLKVTNSTKLLKIHILSAFMDYLVVESLILENYAAILDKPRVYAPKTDYLTYEEIERLFRNEAQNATPKTVDRNLLLLTLFTDLCLRVSEAVNLKLADVRLDAKELWVTRKRGKVEKLPINDYIADKFSNWYAARENFSGNHLPFVFITSHGKQLSPRQTHYIVRSALERAGIVKRKMGPHLLRHSGASLMAMSGENLIMIQYLLGHENLNTTRRYLHFDWNDLKDMMQRSPQIL